jgi:hypothetical protein
MRFIGRLRPSSSVIFPADRTFLCIQNLHDLSACLSFDGGRVLEIRVPREKVKI